MMTFSACADWPPNHVERTQIRSEHESQIDNRRKQFGSIVELCSGSKADLEEMSGSGAKRPFGQSTVAG
jgi:hypothetical protein